MCVAFSRFLVRPDLSCVGSSEEPSGRVDASRARRPRSAACRLCYARASKTVQRPSRSLGFRLVSPSAGRRRASGGAAGAGGYSFSSRVAAAYAVDILRGSSWPARWELPAGTRLTALMLETEQAVDDLELATSDGGQVLLQIKRSVTASSGETSQLSSAVDQFVRQYLGIGRPEHQRPFDASRDRLVLACGSPTGRRVTQALPAVLGRIRDTTPQDLDAPGLRNADETAAWTALLSVVRHSWQLHAGRACTHDELVGLLRALWVEQLDVEDGERDEAVVLGWLTESILADPAQARLAWTTLLDKTLRAGAERSGADARRLREVLIRVGVGLAVPADVRTDVERLSVRSLSALSHLAVHGGLVIDGTQRRLQRDLAAPLAARVKTGSCLVVGAPGAGKTGALYTLAGQLAAEGHDLVVLAADMLEVPDLDSLREKLQLTRPVDEILADWPGDKPGVVIIDALDAARGPDGPAALTQLVERVAASAGRWHVVASVRTFDLRHNAQLRAAVPKQSTAENHRLSEFAELEHFLVDDLTDADLAQLADLAPEVHAVVADAPRPLLQLVANPFNLSLLASLVQHQVNPASLRPLRTQLELLQLYWQTLVLSPAAGSDARQAVLATVCERALAQMRLQVGRQAVVGAHPGDALHELLSAGVLLEVPSGGLLEPQRLGFSHHVLFDFAFALLVLCHEADALTQQLGQSPDLLLLARPALVMKLTALWERGGDHADFWETALALADPANDDLVRLVAPAVVVDLVEQPEDLAAIVACARSSDAEGGLALRLLEEVVQALLAAGVDTRPLRDADIGLWARVAAMTCQGPGGPALEPLRMLVWALSREADSEAAAGQPTDELAAGTTDTHALSDPSHDDQGSTE
jgi:hypothetical protein